jgi:hypothetical protein
MEFSAQQAVSMIATVEDWNEVVVSTFGVHVSKVFLVCVLIKLTAKAAKQSKLMS